MGILQQREVWVESILIGAAAVPNGNSCRYTHTDGASFIRLSVSSGHPYTLVALAKVPALKSGRSPLIPVILSSPLQWQSSTWHQLGKAVVSEGNPAVACPSQPQESPISIPSYSRARPSARPPQLLFGVSSSPSIFSASAFHWHGGIGLMDADLSCES